MLNESTESDEASTRSLWRILTGGYTVITMEESLVNKVTHFISSTKLKWLTITQYLKNR
ncbi:hypothetical protein DYY67_1746 [Candidatus Nitrosotalea sp. TS]|nr:hypothetical protein [Candidatus Nitrosotalea sp. TS]